MTKGKYAYDFGDTGHLTPLVKMHTLGSSFVPPGFHAGGLRYHGMSPVVSHLKELGLIEAVAYHQTPCFDAAVQFARAEGIVPAPEASHAVKAVVDEALACKQEGTSRTILFNLSGHGHFDMQTYTEYFAGNLVDQDYSQTELDQALAALPQLAAGITAPRRVGSVRRLCAPGGGQSRLASIPAPIAYATGAICFASASRDASADGEAERQMIATGGD